jgi:hypothetical protein
MNQREYEIIDYLREENRVLREQLGPRRLRSNDHQRRRLAVKAKGLTRRLTEEMSPMVRWETLLAWHRKRIAQKYDGSGHRGPGQPRRAGEIEALVLRMAEETEVGAIGVSRAHSVIWDTRWHAARLPTY